MKLSESTKEKFFKELIIFGNPCPYLIPLMYLHKEIQLQPYPNLSLSFHNFLH